MSNHVLSAANSISESSQWIAQVCSGLAALIAAYSAVLLNRRETDQVSLQTLKHKLTDAIEDLGTYESYCYQLTRLLRTHGVEVPLSPRLRSDDWG